MRCCPACSLPLADAAEVCAFCGRIAERTRLFRMRPEARGFGWSESPAEPLAHARLENGLWTVSAAKGHSGVHLTFIEGSEAGSFAIVDDLVRPWASLTLGTTGLGRIVQGSAAGSFRLASGKSLFVRTDGPTGLHLVDAKGNVAALASGTAGLPLAGVDVLVLAEDLQVPPMAYFAAFLGLFLARLARARCDYSALDCLCLDAYSQPGQELC